MADMAGYAAIAAFVGAELSASVLAGQDKDREPAGGLGLV